MLFHPKKGKKATNIHNPKINICFALFIAQKCATMAKLTSLYKFPTNNTVMAVATDSHRTSLS